MPSRSSRSSSLRNLFVKTRSHLFHRKNSTKIPKQLSNVLFFSDGKQPHDALLPSAMRLRDKLHELFTKLSGELEQLNTHATSSTVDQVSGDSTENNPIKELGQDQLEFVRRVEPCKPEQREPHTDDEAEIFVLGEGRYGTVFLAHWESDLAAVKTLRQQVSQRDFELEVDLVARLSQTGATPRLLAVVRPRGFLMDFIGCPTTYATLTLTQLVYAYQTGQFDNRNDLLSHGSSMSTIDWLELCVKICLKAGKIHSLNVVHCDIKMDNILLEWSDVGGCYQPYFVDLGLSLDADLHRFGIALEGIQPEAYRKSHPFVAPELCHGVCFSFGTDVYAMGRILQRIGAALSIDSLSSIGVQALNENPARRPSMFEMARLIQKNSLERFQTQLVPLRALENEKAHRRAVMGRLTSRRDSFARPESVASSLKTSTSSRFSAVSLLVRRRTSRLGRFFGLIGRKVRPRVATLRREHRSI